jgi:hypothetical protein
MDFCGLAVVYYEEKKEKQLILEQNNYVCGFIR